MVKSILHFAFLFVALVLAQAVVFNHICLFGVAVPIVFIYLLIKLPVTLGLNYVISIAFFLGLTVDVFSDTQGMNALACVILAALRMPVLRLYFPREDEMPYPVPSARSLGVSAYYKYEFSLCLIYCILFFLIESFSFFNLLRLIVKILSSTLLTFVIFVAIDSLTSRNREKRL